MTVSIREWIWREHWWKEQLLFLAGKSHMSPTAVCLWGGQWRLFIPGHRSLCFYTSVFLFISCHSALQGGYKHKQSTGTAEVFADVRFRHDWFSVQNLRKYVHSINITCKRAALIQSQCLKAWKTFPETHTAIRTCWLLPPLRNCHEEWEEMGKKFYKPCFQQKSFSFFFFSLQRFLTELQWRNADPKRAIYTDKTESAVMLAALRGQTLARKCSELNICTLYSEVLMLSW